MKTMYCKTCGAKIAKSAKSCPQCGARIRKPVRGLIVLIILMIILGAILAGALGDNDKPQIVDSDSEQQTVDKAEKNEFGIGEKVELQKTITTLKSVTESEGSPFNEPAEGNVFVLCEFEIENNSSKEIAISSLLNFKGYCDDYALSFSLSALLEKGDKNQLDGTIAPGKKMNGVIGYEVSENWKEIEIIFTPNFYSSKDITFVAYHTENNEKPQ